MLKVCYIDASLRDDTGHFANMCRAVTGELRSRGHQVDIYANKHLTPELQVELKATALIQHHQQDQLMANDQGNFKLAMESLLCDLQVIWQSQIYDLIYINSVLPPQFAAEVRRRRYISGPIRFQTCTACVH